MTNDLELYVYVVQAALIKLFTRYIQKGHLTPEEKAHALKFMVEIGKSFLRKSASTIYQKTVNDGGRNIDQEHR